MQIASFLGENCSRPILSNVAPILRSMRTFCNSSQRAVRLVMTFLALRLSEIWFLIQHTLSDVRLRHCIHHVTAKARINKFKPTH